MTEPIDLDAVAAKWLQQCGYCDAGIGECAHPEDDYRPVMLSLVREIERLRRELAESRSLIDQMHRAGDHSALTGAWLQRDTAIEQRDQARAEVERYRRIVEAARLWRSGNGARNHQERVAQMMALIDAIDASIAGEDF